MKRFLKRILAFMLVFLLGPLLLFSFGCFVVGNQYDDNYMGSVQDKIERLNSLPSPKIILVGNSNLSFGINSKLIEEELGMPVVNLGLHGGVGNAFLERMAKSGIGEGDIVVVSHTNYSEEDQIGDPVLAWTALEYNWELWEIPRLKDWKRLISAYPTYMLYSLKQWAGLGGGNEKSSYVRSVLNEYGDVYLRPEKKVHEFVNPVEVPVMDDVFVERLNAYNDYVLSRGAKLVFAGYPIGDGELTAPREDFIAFRQELASKLDCPVISDFEDYFIPYGYFYDTNLHLTAEGADIRTRQLIEDLKTWMEDEN